MGFLSKRFPAILFAVLSAAILMGAANLMRSENQMGVVLHTSNGATAYQVNNSSALPANLRDYNEVCWHNRGTDSSKYVYIATFSTVAEGTYGWSVQGTEKECHDWGANIPLFLFHGDSDSAQSVAFMFSK